METPFTLPIETYWKWLGQHANCILQVASQDFVLNDDDEMHWQVGGEAEEEYYVQLCRGKRILAEFSFDLDWVSFVQEVPVESEDEVVFELIVENDGSPFPAYVFVMSHGYEEKDPAPGRPIH